MALGRKAKFYLDLLERTLWTGVQSLGGSEIVENLFMEHRELSTKLQFQFALVMAGLAMFKSLAATKLPWANETDGSTLPEEVQP